MASKKVESTDSFTIMQHAVNRILDILNSVDVFPNASAEEVCITILFYRSFKYR